MKFTLEYESRDSLVIALIPIYNLKCLEDPQLAVVGLRMRKCPHSEFHSQDP